MIPTSLAFQEAIAKGTRISTARLNFGVIDVTAKLDATVSVTDKQSFIDETQVIDDIESTSDSLATFEDNFLKLDGTFNLMPDDISPSYKLGWWSEKLSNSQAEFEIVENLIIPEKQTFSLDRWNEYGEEEYAVVTVTQNQYLATWNTASATRIQSSGGDSELKYYASVRLSEEGQPYTMQVKIKNQGSSTVWITMNLEGVYVGINPNEEKLVTLTATGNGSNYLLFCFCTNSISDNLDVVVFEPQVERGLQASEFSSTFSEKPSLTFDFGANHSSVGVKICFDREQLMVCDTFDVFWYDSTDAEIGNESIIGNTDYEVNIEKNIENYRRIKFVFHKTDLPYRYVKVNEVIFGLQEVFDGTEIISGNILEELDPISDVLSINTMKTTLLNKEQKFNMINPQGIYSYLQQRQKLELSSGLLLEDGTVEYVPLGTYYLSAWTNSNGLTATLSATDIIGVLDKTNYYSSPFWDNEPITNVIQHILTDAGGFQFTISDELALETVTGYLPIMSHRVALQTLLTSARGTVRNERDNSLYFFRPEYVKDKDINYDVIIGTPRVEQRRLITGIEVPEINYKAKTVVEEVGNLEMTLTTTETVIYPFTQAISSVTAVNISGNGAIVGAPVISVSCVIMQIAGSGTFTISIMGTGCEITRTLFTATQALLAGEFPQVARLNDNPLLTKNGKAIAEYMLAYYQRRIVQQIPYWNDPSLQAGDTVNVQTMFNVYYEGMIEKQEIEFAPYLKGKMEVVG